MKPRAAPVSFYASEGGEHPPHPLWPPIVNHEGWVPRSGPGVRSLMRTSRIQSRVATFAGAIVLLLQVSPAMAGDQRDKNRPVEVTFTKWVLLNSVNMEGVTGGAVRGVFVGETLQSQMSVNPDLKGKVNRLEVVYEVQDQDGDHDFTALIRGGSNRVEGVGLFDGVILAGWRTGARVQVAWQRYLGFRSHLLGRRRTPRPELFQGNHLRWARPKELKRP